MIRLAVRCRPEQAELVLAELVELAPGGVEQTEGKGYVEYAIYGAPGELPEIPDLEAAAGPGLVDVRTSELDNGWDREWRRFHRPVLVGGRIHVRPPWEDPPADPAVIDLEIDPGRAFGTGAHPTTRLCLELLLAVPAGERASLADLGSGSGVLAIAAAKLGWRPIVACDSEVAALCATRRNADRNGVAVDAERIDLRAGPLPPAETVTANLTHDLLLAVAARIDPGARPRRLVCSGFLDVQEEEVAAALEEAGFAVAGRRSAGEWRALVLERQ